MNKNKLFRATVRMKGVVSFALPAIVGLALAVPAAQAGTTTTVPTTITSVQDLLDSLCNIFGWMFLGLIALSGIMAVWAAFMYVTADGDAEKVSKATKTLTYVAIGVAVALLARALPIVVANFFQATLSSGTC